MSSSFSAPCFGSPGSSPGSSRFPHLLIVVAVIAVALAVCSEAVHLRPSIAASQRWLPPAQSPVDLTALLSDKPHGSGSGGGSSSSRGRGRKGAGATVFAGKASADRVASGKVAAELLRFVTAFGTGFEAVVDITPYAPLLSAAVDRNGSIGFYSFIDTWVNNNSVVDLAYLDNVSGQCSLRQRDYGNGWSLSLDLLLWHDDSVLDLKPEQTTMLATGYFGSNLPFGTVRLQEGRLLDDTTVEFDENMDFSSSASLPRVYACSQGGSEVKRAALLGYAGLALQEAMAQQNLSSDEARPVVLGDMLQFMISPLMRPLEVLETFPSNSSILVRFNTTTTSLRHGSPVYFDGGVVTDQLLDGSRWWNLSYPFEPIGHVQKVWDDKKSAVLVLNHSRCLPSNETNGLPRFVTPAGPSVLSEAESLLKAALSVEPLEPSADVLLEPPFLQPATDAWSRWEAASEMGAFFQDTPEEAALQQLTPLGRLTTPILSHLDAGVPSGPLDPLASHNLRKVCAVSQQRQGQLLSRTFEYAPSSSKDRAVFHLTATGHGWAMTSESCGEYCHVLYRLSLNGKSAGNITQFRNDCDANPIDGSVQLGTWWEHRNGWCPGAVEPGFFMDVTEFLEDGRNELSLDVLVYNTSASSSSDGDDDADGSDHGRGYTDFAGFALGDQAFLTVAMSVSRYSAETVAAIKSQKKVLTAAEAAIRHGSNYPSSLKPFEDQKDLRKKASLISSSPSSSSSSSSSVSSSSSSSWPRPSSSEAESDSNGGFDFEASAPWYLFNSSSEEDEAELEPSKVAVARIPLFDRVLIQGSSRIRLSSIDREQLPAHWHQAGLHLRLQQPEGLNFDRWDRVASAGLVLEEGAQEADILFDEDVPGHRRWKMNPALQTLSS